MALPPGAQPSPILKQGDPYPSWPSTSVKVTYRIAPLTTLQISKLGYVVTAILERKEKLAKQSGQFLSQFRNCFQNAVRERESFSLLSVDTTGQPCCEKTCQKKKKMFKSKLCFRCHS